MFIQKLISFVDFQSFISYFIRFQTAVTTGGQNTSSKQPKTTTQRKKRHSTCRTWIQSKAHSMRQPGEGRNCTLQDEQILRVAGIRDWI